ncbi:MAG: hypothetical protein AAFO69_14615, partial [Bacteroidota bacterium]
MYKLTYLWCLLLLLLSVGTVHAQISGESTVLLESTHQYTINTGGPAIVNWRVNNGTELNRSNIGSTYYVTVRWDQAPGNGSVLVIARTLK